MGRWTVIADRRLVADRQRASGRFPLVDGVAAGIAAFRQEGLTPGANPGAERASFAQRCPTLRSLGSAPLHSHSDSSGIGTFRHDGLEAEVLSVTQPLETSRFGILSPLAGGMELPFNNWMFAPPVIPSCARGDVVRVSPRP